MHSLGAIALFVLICSLWFVAGFGVGRIKNLGKIQTYANHVNAIEAAVGTESHPTAMKVRTIIQALRKAIDHA